MLKSQIVSYRKQPINQLCLIISNAVWQCKTMSGKAQDWIVQCFTSPPTQYRLYGRRFLQVKRPNQQYQSTEGQIKTTKTTKYTHAHTI